MNNAESEIIVLADQIKEASEQAQGEELLTMTTKLATMIAAHVKTRGVV
ncbi:hypothetical protein [Salipiger aestuarii]|nr:hypothetical protein [Salipiger aestuarii]